MGYFQIGFAIAVIVCTVILMAPLRSRSRVFLAGIFSDTILGEAFEAFDDEDDPEEIVFAAFFATFLWTLFTVALWLGLLVAWPLAAPAAIIVIFVWRKQISKVQK